MPKIAVKGTVFSGSGEGKKFIDLPWVKQQIQQKLGFTPFSGTLNLRLTKDSLKDRMMLEKAAYSEIKPEKGYCPGLLIRALVGDVEAAIVVPQVPSYPNDAIEVIAPVCLRSKFRLADGAVVSVTVDV